MTEQLNFEQVLQNFKNDVQHAILDSQRVIGRSEDPYTNAKAVYDAHYAKALHKSVLDEYKQTKA